MSEVIAKLTAIHSPGAQDKDPYPMSKQRRYYSAGIEEALFLLSGGSCYHPECGEPTIRFAEEGPKKNVVVAHIHAFEKNGPREIPTMTNLERNSFPNLILLCNTCHNVVDHNVIKYPAELLKTWKREREKQPIGSLAGLRGLDRDGMEGLLDDAMSELRQDIAEVASNFPEVAQLLKNVLSELPQLDPESIRTLDSAASRLGLPDHAPMLAEAARRLDLPDYAPLIDDAARKLHLPDYVPALLEAAQILKSLPDTMEFLDATTRTLRNLTDQLQILDFSTPVHNAEEVSIRLSHKINQINESVGSVERVIEEAKATSASNVNIQLSDNYWKVLLIGWAGWLVVILIVVVYLANNSSAQDEPKPESSSNITHATRSP